jgi:hypothetical protein
MRSGKLISENLPMAIFKTRPAIYQNLGDQKHKQLFMGYKL